MAEKTNGKTLKKTGERTNDLAIGNDTGKRPWSRLGHYSYLFQSLAFYHRPGQVEGGKLPAFNDYLIWFLDEHPHLQVRCYAVNQTNWQGVPLTHIATFEPKKRLVRTVTKPSKSP